MIQIYISGCIICFIITKIIIDKALQDELSHINLNHNKITFGIFIISLLSWALIVLFVISFIIKLIWNPKQD